MNLFYPHSRLFPRSSYLWLVFLLIATLLAIGPHTWPSTAPASLDGAVIAPDLGKLPLSFAPSAGQADSTARFQVHTLGGDDLFHPRRDGVVVAASGSRVSIYTHRRARAL